MITIAHGSDTAASRKFYIEERQKRDGFEVMEGGRFDYNAFFQMFEGNSLFESEKHIFIENFFGKIKSNSTDFKQITDYINKHKDINVFFWEEKELTKPQTFVFKNAIQKSFNYPQVLFVFLDGLKPGNSKLIQLFHELLKTMEPEIAFYMMIRQFRLMLALLSESDKNIEEVKRLAPWQSSKLKSQAAAFGTDKLIELYKKLYKIDYETKYGLSSLNLTAAIDIFLSSL